MKINLNPSDFKIKVQQRNDFRQMMYEKAKSNLKSNDVLDQIKSALDEMIGMAEGEDHSTASLGGVFNISSASIRKLHKYTKYKRGKISLRNNDARRERMKKDLVDSMRMAINLDGRYVRFNAYSYNSLMAFYARARIGTDTGAHVPRRRFIHAAVNSINKTQLTNLFK